MDSREVGIVWMMLVLNSCIMDWDDGDISFSELRESLRMAYDSSGVSVVGFFWMGPCRLFQRCFIGMGVVVALPLHQYIGYGGCICDLCPRFLDV